MSYIKNILIGFDQFANTLIGGSPDETISSRFGRAVVEDRCLVCKWVCAVLHLIDENHCLKNIEPIDRAKSEVVHLSDKPK